MKTTFLRASLLAFTLLVLLGSGNAQVQFCMDLPTSLKKADGAGHGVSSYTSRWTNGSTITVKFTGGTELVRTKVRTYSKMWESYANVTFKFVETGVADILVAFDEGGSWSYIGTDSRLYSHKEKPSMNYGWFDENTTEEEFQRTILHEFGHALGLLHEHKNPTSDIEWNLPVVYNYYMSQGWTKAQIDEQVLNKYSVTLSNHNYDPSSIMHYPIPANFTTNGYEVTWNTTLSKGDIELISEMYPKSAVKTETNSTGTNGSTAIVPATCSLEDVEVEHNITMDGKKGMKIFTSFTINNAKDKECLVSAYFYTADGAALKDNNRKYHTMDGKVATWKTVTPLYPNTKFTRMELFMPYDELELKDGEHKLKFSMSVWDENRKSLVTGGIYYFDYSKGIICNDLKVLESYENDNSRMAIMPKFSIKNAQGLDCRAVVYFYNADDTPMLDSNKQPIKFTMNFKPGYPTTVYNFGEYSDLFIHVPYSTFTLPKGAAEIKYFVALFSGQKQFATSPWMQTVFTTH